jgi:hypothetical protein
MTTVMGVCVAMERKTGTFMLIILFVGIPERTQTTLALQAQLEKNLR